MEIIDNSAIADSNELIFIDTNIDDYQSLIPEGNSAELVLLDSSRNGIEQITEILVTRSDISAINIISHGNDAELQLGDGLLNHNNLQNYAAELQSWSHALTEDADILLFGCNVGKTELGENFVQQLSDLTGADIAASDDLTGNAALNGDWNLEFAIGTIEKDSAWITKVAADFDSVLISYNGNEYQLTSGNMTWAEAQAEAESLGGNLVTISDAAEQAWLEDTFGGNERLWTGLSDRVNEGEFTWVSGQALNYTNWATNQPNNFGQGEDFTAFLASGQWNDIGGNANLRGIIEIGGDNPNQQEPEVFSYNGNQYQLTSANIPWAQAQAEAESLGGNLVSINDAAEQAWLQDTFGGNEQLWTGLSDRINEGEFTWVSGQTFNYSNWALNEPNNFGQGEDFTVLIPNGQWSDRSGNANLRGIIEIGDANPIDSEVFNYNGNQYQLTSTNLTWTQAQAEAESLGGNLVTISDAAEQAWVEDTFGGDQRLWIGLNDHTIEGEFVWPNDEATNFTNWAPNQPNNFGLGEDFVALQKNGQWNDYAGALKIRGVIEIGSSNPSEPGIIGLETNSYQVNESDGSVEVTVLRTQGSDGVITVDYQTFEASATADEDYIPVSGTLTFADGETSKSVTIPIIDDQQPEATENFSITIDNVTGGATLLAPRTALIDIIGIDGTPPGSGNGLRGEYFDDIDFTNTKVIRTDNTVNFNWGTGSPDPAIAADTFSVRWTGEIEARFSETYNFQTTTDDGVRLWINDQLVIDQFIDQPPTSHQGAINLIAGQRYDIELEYYENGGGAVAELAWSSASQTFEIVPQSQLYSEPGDGTFTKETVFSGLNQPTAIDWSPGGDLTFIAEKGGVIKVADNGQVSNFIDISAQVNGVRDRGLLDIAIHPDFFDGSPYVYALYTHDPAEVFQNSGLAGPDGIGNRAGRLTRITADANNDFKTAVPGSEVVILGTNSTWDNFNAFVNSTNDFNEPPAGILPDGTNVEDFLAADSESHTIGGVEFGPDGALYVSNGDGTSYNRVDPRTVRVQDIDNLSGKILRIDPITGDGLSDNPFYNGNPDANRSKVYQYGLRNPFRIAVDPADGKVYTGDVGWTQWEEINAAGPGANFGWPYYEGGSGTNLQTGGYRDLPESQAFYNSGESAEPSILALNHGVDGINAIVLGDIYRGNNFPEEYQGDLFFNDLGQGIVRNVSFDESGNVASVDTFTTGANVVVQIKQGPDDRLYFVDLDDGLVGRWKFA